MKFVSIMIIIVMVATLFGCGGNRRAGEVDFARYFNDRSLFYGQTLTISNFTNANMFMATRIQEMALLYMSQNPGVVIQVLTPIIEWQYDEPRERYREHISMELMAGTAPTMVEIIGLDWMDLRTNRLFADWMPIMRADPDFNEDDYFMEIIEMIKTNAGGRLVIYPTMFSMRMFAANTAIPGLAEAVAQLPVLTSADLIRLNHEFNPDGHFYISPSFSPGAVTIMNINNFLDMENLVADFDNPEFVEMITEALEFTCRETFRNPFFPTGFMNPPQLEMARSQRFLFSEGHSGTLQFFFNDDDALFSTPRPFANSAGSPLVAPAPAMQFAITAGATPIQQALAWDFMRFIQTPREGFMPLFSYQPVYRPMTLFHLESQIPVVLDVLRGRIIGEASDPQYLIAEIYEALNRFTELPPSPSSALDSISLIETIITETLRYFEDGLITAQAAAELIQNRVTIALMEMD